MFKTYFVSKFVPTIFFSVANFEIFKWASWEEWSTCSNICGEETTTRKRMCMEPILGGVKCPKNFTEETKSCDKTKCLGIFD